MKLFRVKGESMNFCGLFDEIKVLAEDEDAVEKTKEYQEFVRTFQEYVTNNLEEEDFEEYGEDADLINVEIIDEEEDD